MSRSRAAATSLLAVALLAGTGLRVLAKDAPRGPDAVLEYSTSDGTQAGTITVRQIEDPFTGFTPDDPPGPDQRYVELTVRFEAHSDKPFDAQPSRIVIQDSDGFIWGATDINRPADALPPSVSDQGLAPGDRVTGVIGYALPTDAVIDEILYSPQPAEDPTIQYRPETGARLLTILDQLPNEVPALGTPVSDVSPDGSAAGTLTVSGITDPFTPFVPQGSPAPDAPGTSLAPGSPSTGAALDPDLRYVLVDVVFEADPAKPFQSAPWFIVLHDTDGNQWGYTEIALPPDAPTREVANRRMGPDDRISGVVGFAIPKDAVIDEVIYEPPYAARRIPIADLTVAK